MNLRCGVIEMGLSNAAKLAVVVLAAAGLAGCGTMKAFNQDVNHTLDTVTHSPTHRHAHPDGTTHTHAADPDHTHDGADSE